MAYRLGVDVGGTFTDLLIVHEKSGKTWSAKVPSTPADQSVGVVNGMMRVCEYAGIDPATILHVMHGNEAVASTKSMTFEEASGKFAGWVDAQAAVAV